MYTALRYIIPKETMGEHIFTPKVEPPPSNVYPEIPSKLTPQEQQGLVHKDKWAGVDNPWAAQQEGKDKVYDPADQWAGSGDPWAGASQSHNQKSQKSQVAKDPWLNYNPWVDPEVPAHVPQPSAVHYAPVSPPGYSIVSDTPTEPTKEA